MSSSTEDSPDTGMALQSHYSLRWNNHQTHILQAFEALLQAEILVDVTLVCTETSLRAHKVVLSACSPFFERIFAEHPCKHPVIVLKDFPGREVTALIDFMYRGEVRVGREELPGLMRAAESLQIRGLVSSEPRPASPPETPTTELLMGEPSTPEGARHSSPGIVEDEANLDVRGSSRSQERRTNSTTILQRENRPPNMGHLDFSVRDLRDLCGSPLLPRRKQARPRRRSGELVAQDLSRPQPPPSLSPPSGLNLAGARRDFHESPNQSMVAGLNTAPSVPTINNNNIHQNQSQMEDIAENLSLKRAPSPESLPDHQNSRVKIKRERTASPRSSPLALSSGDPTISGMHDLSMNEHALASMSSSTTPPHHPSEYLTSLGQFAAQWLPNPNHLSQSSLHHSNNEASPHSRREHNHYQQQQRDASRESQQCRESQQEHNRQEELTLTSIRSVAVYPSIDGMSPVSSAIFPHAAGLDRGSLLADLNDSFKPETLHGLFATGLGHHPTKKSKKHRSESASARRWAEHNRGGMPIGRPKGQHSAPRGGPPRSWTNAELTRALQYVWNKQMTTSQASRMFGIPYNSLLMYVRGKYGKSLKLEQLRRDCTGATTGEVMNSLNNNVKAIQAPPQLSHPMGLPHPADDAPFSHHPLLGANLPQGFFPDYGTGFPVPVSMVHLLPPSEQKALESSANATNLTSNCPPAIVSCPSGSPPGSEIAQKSRSPSPLDNNHETSSPSMTPQAPQSAPALLQQNGSD